MCWSAEDELYNGGQAFKVCARDARGVIVTVIADNYFGYCKKEVKTQISYSANLFGNVRGGARRGGARVPELQPGPGVHRRLLHRRLLALEDVLARDPERFDPQPEGYALDRQQPHIVLVPESATYSSAP